MARPGEQRHNRRSTGSRETRKVLIVCEDELTSPNYFKKFPSSEDDLEIVPVGTGHNTLSLVKEAIRIKNAAERSGSKFISVWCVFDRDSFPSWNFNAAFALAKKNGIKVAYANQCFELWYWLHFDFQQTAVSRGEYQKKLSDRLGRKYNKNDLQMYDDLIDRQPDAIRNSKKLISMHGSNDPESADPSTTIHELVEYLNEFS